MDFKDYCIRTGVSSYLWWNSGKMVKVPVVARTSNVGTSINLTTNDIANFVIGKSARFKKFLKVMLCRNYQPNEIRITEVASNDVYWKDSLPAMVCLPNVRQHTVTDNNLTTLAAYLQSINAEVDALNEMDTMFNCPHKVYIFCGVLSDIFGRTADVTEEYIKARKLLEKLTQKITVGGKISIFFFEKEYTQQIAEEFGIAGSPLCFECDESSSKRAIGTDIASIASSDTDFYMRKFGQLISCEIPEIRDDEYIKMIYSILTNR